MKSAVIVTPFDNYSYNVRIKYIERYLKERGYACTVISADFDHRNKQKYTVQRDNLELIHVPEYKKNLSFGRIYSHYVFAKSVYKRLKELNPDLIYGSAPPNFLFKFISKYKKERLETRLIYEVGDLWPETLPLSGKIKVAVALVLSIWASIRNKHIGVADAVLFECDLFKERIEKHCRNSLVRTIYLCKEDYYLEKVPKFEGGTESLKFAYVGSINNIIDIDLIVDFLVEVKKVKPVVFRIIGAGENKERLITLCKENDVEYQDYDVVYDDQQKENILSDCNFGFNIMKDSVVVGATMKSLEYFHWGLGLINNIPADTQKMVRQNQCGINISSKSVEKAAQCLANMTQEQLLTMRMNARTIYSKYFSESVIKQQFLEILDYIEEK